MPNEVVNLTAVVGGPKCGSVDRKLAVRHVQVWQAT